VTGAPADPTEIPKVYSPAEVENRLYREWETKGYFHAERDPDKEPFTIVIPPPNVTGALHIGHALDHTLQDVLVRFKRMQGYATLWLPGMARG
jgi:valyl-tRNA synthetase